MNQYNDQIDDIFKPAYLDKDGKKKQKPNPHSHNTHNSHSHTNPHPHPHSHSTSNGNAPQNDQETIPISHTIGLNNDLSNPLNNPLGNSLTTTLGNVGGGMSTGIKKIKLKSRYIKQRSRSLPIINYKNSHDRKHLTFGELNISKGSSLKSHTNTPSNTVPLIPPINSNSLKEIDLNEILKNPQLRHDIIFDPQLQFRPNLDGERGKRKKSIIDKYWLEMYKECQQFFEMDVKTPKLYRLPSLFKTLKEILLSILPNNQDKVLIHEILDIDLILQQLNFKNFDFLKLSKVLNKIFKNHCAPIRDDLVNKMLEIFEKAFEFNNCNYLIQGLQKIFQILECMKLDIANHQIRILRPVLIETAIDFEKDYFNQLIVYKKFNLSDSISWFKSNYDKNTELNRFLTPKDSMSTTTAATDKDDRNNGIENLKLNLIYSIFDLLSCKKMVNSFPQSLTFDHTRLILLRADIRQIIVINLCVILFKNLVIDNNLDRNLISNANLQILKQEILSIVTDGNGNIKWTKNIQLISLQLIKNLHCPSIDNKLLEFSSNWLIKQIQPSSKVYQLMEDQYFKNLLTELLPNLNNNQIQPISSSAGISNLNGLGNSTANDCFNSNIANRLLTLVNFNWNVFGDYYKGIA